LDSIKVEDTYMKKDTTIYLIGSLRNPEVISVGVKLREETGFEVFDDWMAPGPEADDWWKKYEEARGRNYEQALEGWAAKHIYEFDKFHLDRADIGILALPAGKSAHLELGYLLGRNKKGYILLPDDYEDGPELRWDVMYQFATKLFSNLDDLITELKKL
jgi:nucleoside 2-deoxyribosyltransferase